MNDTPLRQQMKKWLIYNHPLMENVHKIHKLEVEKAQLAVLKTLLLVWLKKFYMSKLSKFTGVSGDTFTLEIYA